MSTKAQREINHKLRIFEHVSKNKNISFTCRYFGISRDTFYRWKKNYKNKGEQGLINSKPCPENPKLRIPLPIEEKILYLRKTYHFGQLRISWYLNRYHEIKISASGVYQVLKRNDLNRLPQNQRKRSISEIKQYEKHNQANTIDFINYVITKFPFRIHTIQTDNGHEFQSKFHWNLNDLGMNHRYIKPRTPKHNGKVERPHKTEFYQLMTYKDDIDLNKKLAEWEVFYNFDRPHSAMNGKTPYERLLEKIG